MTDSTHTSLSHLFAPFRAGDPAAREGVLAALQDRLRRLVASILPGYPAVERRREVDSLLNDLNVKLLGAVDAGVRPPTADEFVKFAAYRLHKMLLDVKQKLANNPPPGRLGRPGGSSAPGVPEPAGPSDGASVLLQWLEFHQAVRKLGDAPRTVFGLHYFLGVPQAEIAEVLGYTPKQVSRYWLEASYRLRKHVPKYDPPDPGRP